MLSEDYGRDASLAGKIRRMTAKALQFARQNWQLLAVFLVSIGVACWFLAGVVLDLVYFHDPRHQDQPLQAWMTPKFVVMSYDLPRDVVADLLDLPEGGPGSLTMADIAREQGVTLGELTDIVRSAADAHREARDD